MKLKFSACIFTAFALVGCANVDITKTGQGAFAASNPNTVEILKTRPEKAYIELGTFTVTGFSSSDTAKMHNAIREKSAPLGAQAAIITDEGLIPRPFGYDR